MMTKDRLKSGMICTLRNGQKYMVLKDSCYSSGKYSKDNTSDIMICIDNNRERCGGYMSLDTYTNDLTHIIDKYSTIDEAKEWDVVCVTASKYCADYGAYITDLNKDVPIYERKKVKMTLEQIETELGYEVEIIK